MLMDTLDDILPAETAESVEKINRWPMEVRALLALLSKQKLGTNRRKRPRVPLRLEMVLQFQDENRDTISATIYTRDTSGLILGFLTFTPPQPGQRAVLKFDDANGLTKRLPCRVVRCRHVRDGWCEGTLDLSSNREGSSTDGGGLWRKLRSLVGVN